ncbi:LPXTG cell wall anchor domain-containing protein [Streptomyces vastus]|uniref:Gram-positive cocci surface proteins LPxTG domain-containing protein n=1 Tax=Streptomyces vastus TaxID=285451 RepID=A0ABN3RWT5_9ACTN
MRTLPRAGSLAVAAAAALLTAPAAHAAPTAEVLGDNGTVKIHDAGTGEELRKNEPHVCTFYLDGFGFDGGQQVDWHIEAWAPTADVKGETAESGSLSLDAEGHGRTQELSLPDGHYKLFWNFDGEKGAAKHKVFWTDCEESAEDSTGSADSAPAASGSPAVQGAASSPSAQDGGDLAETGSGAPVGLISAAAAALLGAGGYLVFRRRRASKG